MKYVNLFCVICSAMFVVLNIVWDKPNHVVLFLVFMFCNMFAYYLNDRN